MRRSIWLSFVLSVCTIFAFAQPPQGGPGGPGGGPGGGRGPGRGLPPPKNLKVLTPDTYLGVMFSTRAALGVRCDFCHNPQDYSSDEKETKVTARRMMEMVKNINTNTFNGEQKVQCWTCHRGQQKPEAPPPVQAPGGPGGGRGPGGPPPGAPPAQ